MFGHPGKKLLFMGGEFAQRREWDCDKSLDWHLCSDEPLHAGVQSLVRDLNRLYSRTPALYEVDFDGAGFEWSDWSDRDNSVFSWIRYARNGDAIIVAANFTPLVRHNYRIGVPKGGTYAELINTDAVDYGGSGVGNLGQVESAEILHNGRQHSLNLTLPPLATIILKPVSARTAD
jgi:1,4-alpha-glucan branching enzyme